MDCHYICMECVCTCLHVFFVDKLCVSYQLLPPLSCFKYASMFMFSKSVFWHWYSNNIEVIWLSNLWSFCMSFCGKICIQKQCCQVCLSWKWKKYAYLWMNTHCCLAVSETVCKLSCYIFQPLLSFCILLLAQAIQNNLMCHKKPILMFL